MINIVLAGLKIERGYCDDASESKFFTGEVNALESVPEPCTVQIRVGYDLCHYLYLHPYRGMKEMQDAFNRDSMVYTVSSLSEFRSAVIDGSIAAEQKRIEYGDAIVASYHMPEKLRTKKCNEWIRSRERKLPLHIFLSTPRHGEGQDDRCYIMDDESNHMWHWGGFDLEKIKWQKLYDQLLKTERHRKNIDELIDAISV
jgi:hypothetical protein